jgi:hypothetical protein
MNFFLLRITSPFNKRKIKEIPSVKQVLPATQTLQQQQQQQQSQMQHASNIPTPKKFSFNSSNMYSVFSSSNNNSKHSNGNTVTSLSGPLVYQLNSGNENYQQANGQTQSQQHHSRLIMRSNNGSHFVQSESTSLGNDYNFFFIFLLNNLNFEVKIYLTSTTVFFV